MVHVRVQDAHGEALASPAKAAKGSKTACRERVLPSCVKEPPATRGLREGMRADTASAGPDVPKTLTPSADKIARGMVSFYLTPQDELKAAGSPNFAHSPTTAHGRLPILHGARSRRGAAWRPAPRPAEVEQHVADTSAKPTLRKLEQPGPFGYCLRQRYTSSVYRCSLVLVGVPLQALCIVRMCHGSLRA